MTKRSKFKVGDLVTLSAAGKARDGNYSLERTSLGLVVEVERGFVKFPYIVCWMKPYKPKFAFKEYELKKFKAVK